MSTVNTSRGTASQHNSPPGRVGVSNAMIEHCQFHFGFEVDIARAETPGGDRLGMQVPDSERHLASNAYSTAKRHLLGR